MIRAISTVMGDSWEATAADLSMMQLTKHNILNEAEVWGEYLALNGFTKGLLPSPCPNCVTVKEFVRIFPYGTYVVATGSHVVAVIDGDYYDTSDTGDEVLIYFWRKR